MFTLLTETAQFSITADDAARAINADQTARDREGIPPFMRTVAGRVTVTLASAAGCAIIGPAMTSRPAMIETLRNHGARI